MNETFDASIFGIGLGMAWFLFCIGLCWLKDGSIPGAVGMFGLSAIALSAAFVAGWN